MINAEKLVEEIRREFASVEQEIRRHPYLATLETAPCAARTSPGRGKAADVIQSDFRSVALVVNPFGSMPSGPFFQVVLGGETAAPAVFGTLAAAVGMDDAFFGLQVPVSVRLPWLSAAGTSRS